MKNQFNRTATVWLFASLFLFSCQENEELISDQYLPDSENFVSIDMAKDLAGNMEFSNQYESTNGRSNKREKKKVKKTKSIKSKDGQTAFHILNYEGGGFMIVSADNRREPVLAFSETSIFESDGDTYKNGVSQWMEQTSDNIQWIRQDKQTQNKDVKKLWDKYLNGDFDLNQPVSESSSATNAREPDIDPNDCTTTYEFIGPLMTSKWGQEKGYNDLAPSMGCDQALQGGRAKAGCVAVAMAQIIRYHEYPNTYNWAAMKDKNPKLNTDANYTIQIPQLMRDLGDHVDMDWGCGASTANTKNEAVTTLGNVYGYRYAKYGDFYTSRLKADIRNGKPVILVGYRSRTFGIAYNGHAWVCDGFRRYDYCTMSTLKIHMNWGWSGSKDGWFAFNTWNPTPDRNYQYKQEMVYLIKP